MKNPTCQNEITFQTTNEHGTLSVVTATLDHRNGHVTFVDCVGNVLLDNNISEFMATLCQLAVPGGVPIILFAATREEADALENAWLEAHPGSTKANL